MSWENPFSTKFVRPGALAYRLFPRRRLDDLLQRFETIGRAAQIVGPHGSGKSTLLADLVRRWEQKAERVVVLELHDGRRKLPRGLAAVCQKEDPTILAVDGYEQLSSAARRGVRRFCRRNGLGLVVTSHRSVGLPDLARCTPSLGLVGQLVRELVDDEDFHIAEDEIRRSFDRHEGNVREILFDMYDLQESKHE